MIRSISIYTYSQGLRLIAIIEKL